VRWGEQTVSDTQNQAVDGLGEVFGGTVQLLADKMGISLDTHAGILVREGNRVSIEFKEQDEFPGDEGPLFCLKYKDGVCVLWVPT
jgi:hypothetical protein